MKHAGVYDILTNPKIVDCVADLLGDDVIAWGSHFFCKMPGDGRAVAWHQDASYWPLSPSWAVTVWLAVDDADLDNGCMKFIAGSHHSGHLTYRKSSPEEHNVLDQTVENAESFGPIVVDDLKAGQVSIHNDLLLHGSDPNNSPTRRRCGLTLRYCHASVRAAMDWNQKGVVVRGQDPAGHWKILHDHNKATKQLQKRCNYPWKPNCCVDNCWVSRYLGVMSTSPQRPNRKAVRFDSLEQEVFLGLWRTYDRLRMLEDELFQKFDLTPQQYNAMRVLRSEHPVRCRHSHWQTGLCREPPTSRGCWINSNNGA